MHYEILKELRERKRVFQEFYYEFSHVLNCRAILLIFDLCSTLRRCLKVSKYIEMLDSPCCVI